MRARSAGPWALLLSCLLIASQWLLVTHSHADISKPAPQHAPHACDLCVAFAAAAPAPEQTAPVVPTRSAAVVPRTPAGLAPEARRPDAHRSRAPPVLRSV